MKAGAPSSGWTRHKPVLLPSGPAAPARAIPIDAALGWLVAVGAGQGGDGVGPSLTWLGRVADWGVRLVAQGAIVPTLRSRRPAQGGLSQHTVRWVPALVEQRRLDEMARAMPSTVAVLERAEAKSLLLVVLGSVVDAIATDAAGRLELPAPPPAPRTAAAAEAFLTRLDGSPFEAPTSAGAELARRLELWSRPVTAPSGSRLVVQLDPPDKGGAWYLSVLGHDPDDHLVPVEVALVDGRSKRHLSGELVRLERLLPVLLRPGALRRGQVYLSDAEAWELMTVTGPALEAAGFDVRVPALSRRKPSPVLRLTAEAFDRASAPTSS